MSARGAHDASATPSPAVGNKLRAAASFIPEALMGRGDIGSSPTRTCDDVLRDIRRRTATERVRMMDLFEDFDQLGHGEPRFSGGTGEITIKLWHMDFVVRQSTRCSSLTVFLSLPLRSRLYSKSRLRVSSRRGHHKIVGLMSYDDAAPKILLFVRMIPLVNQREFNRSVQVHTKVLLACQRILLKREANTLEVIYLLRQSVVLLKKVYHLRHSL